jgi:hypothetical protein
MVLLGSVTAAIIEGPNHGWGSAPILGLFLVAAVAAAKEPRVDQRLMSPQPRTSVATARCRPGC